MAEFVTNHLQSVDDAALQEAEACFIPGQNHAYLGEIVPAAYERYCKVLHPPSVPGGDGNLKPTSWSALARTTGRELDPSTCGADLATSYRQSVGTVEEPHQGSYTATVQRGELLVYQLRIGSLVEALRTGGQELRIGFSELTGGPFTKLALASANFGSRQFFCASLADGKALDTSLEVFTGVIWPDDLSWWVTTDIDLDFTLVGGSVDDVDAAIENYRFEALALTASGLVQPTDKNI